MGRNLFYFCLGFSKLSTQAKVVKLTYIQQSGSPLVGDGGDQYTGLDRFGWVIDQRWIKDSSGADLERVEYGFDSVSNRVWRDNTVANALSAYQDEFYTYDGLNQLLTLQRGTPNSDTSPMPHILNSKRKSHYSYIIKKNLLIGSENGLQRY